MQLPVCRTETTYIRTNKSNLKTKIYIFIYADTVLLYILLFIHYFNINS